VTDTVAPGILFFMRSIFLGVLMCFSAGASAASVPSRFEAIATEAEAARAQDHIADAIRLYSQGTRLRPSWAEGWWYLGSLLYDQDRYSEAANAFQHVLTSTKHRAPALALFGLCEYETGRYDDALAQFRAWAGAGWAGTPQLRDVAVFHFALLLTRDRRFVESLYLLSLLAQRLGDTPELTEAMGLASLRITNLPEDYPPELRERIWLAGKAAFYAAQSPADSARADEFAARLESRYTGQADVHYFRATLYGFEGNKVDAEREYRQELSISPRHAPSLVALAALELDKGEVAQAGTLARQAVDADPGNAEAHHLLGRVYLANGELRSSLAELEEAKRLAPDSAAVRSHLAMVYSKLGRAPEAKAESAAFMALKNKEDIMAPPQEKLGAVKRESSR
jgi:tetratricopeptide (TPR) repeat protein